MTVNMQLDLYRTQMQLMWTLAQKYDQRFRNGQKRLENFSLLKRIFLYTKFNSLRRKINTLKTNRDNYVWFALGLSKKVITLEKSLTLRVVR